MCHKLEAIVGNQWKITQIFGMLRCCCLWQPYHKPFESAPSVALATTIASLKKHLSSFVINLRFWVFLHLLVLLSVSLLHVITLVVSHSGIGKRIGLVSCLSVCLVVTAAYTHYSHWLSTQQQPTRPAYVSVLLSEVRYTSLLDAR